MTGRVNLFIAGMQKAGTTALHSILAGHPQIAASQPKEPHFFDNPALDWSAPPYSKLERCFPAAATGAKWRLEATPILSFWPPAMERIARYNPQARLILLLRHPAFRAHAHWRMETARAAEQLDFATSIGPEGRSRAVGPDGLPHRVHSYVERGFYAPQLRRVLQHFPRDQVLFLRTDRMWSDPRGTLETLAGWLGLEGAIPLPAAPYITPVDSRHLDQMLPEARAMLDLLFREDIQETADLSKLDLTDWLSADYQEPMPRG